jgi:hypothetical protein
MRRLICLALLVVASASAQGPVGPPSGGVKGVRSFTFQNANGLIGSVTNPNSDVILSLQIANNAINLSQLANISTGVVIGRKTAGTGPPELLAPSDVLDLIGNTRGSLIYRGAIGWAVLTPATSGWILTSGGAGADPVFVADGNEKTANKNQNNGYLGLDSGGLVPDNRLQADVELTTHKGAVSGYAPLGADQKVPQANLGSGSDGSGAHFLADDKAYHTLAGGGSVSTVTTGNLSPLFTVAIANPTTTPAFTFTLSNAAGYSWFGNAAAGSGAPSYNTTPIPASLMPALTGDVTNSAGTLATTISASAVTYAKIQNVAAVSLLGNPNGSGAAPIEITLDGGLSFSSGKLRAFKTSQSLSAYAIDVSTTKSFYKTLVAGTNTFTWSNVADGDSFTVSCKQVASGSVGIVVFPATGSDGAHTTYWQGGSQPTQTTTVNKRDRYQFHCYNGGDIDAMVLQNF